MQSLPTWLPVFAWVGFIGIIAFTILTVLYLFRNLNIEKKDFFFWLSIIIVLPVIGSLIYLETTKHKYD